MAKIRTHYVCRDCGRTAAKALGRCPQCGEWESYQEEILEATGPRSSSRNSIVAADSAPITLNELQSQDSARMNISIQEFSRVLGGGVVPGSLVLMGGDPGIGKSTLLLQTALEISSSKKVLYISGEESPSQIKMRADRLQASRNGKSSSAFPDSLLLLTETNIDSIFQHVRNEAPDLLIVDSIQTIYDPALDSGAGSITQLRQSSDKFRQLAKSSGLAIFLIGHVTKEGVIAGPRLLEHMVDTVLYLEGDRYQSYRLLRAVKNRFGATDEVGVFEMAQNGMLEVRNPSEAFLAERVVNSPGSAIAVSLEGTRPLLVEVQGLTSPTTFGNPRRSANGIDMNRLLLIAAVLTRRVGLKLGDQDVFVNVVGGLRVSEPAADLAVACSIASSIKDQPLRADTVFIGELGLSGELRTVPHSSARIKETQALGFKRAIIPKRIRKSEKIPKGIELVEARTLRDAIKLGLLA
jgi:DNA repair protein RadA/Sms